MKQFVITIGRQLGSGGKELAERLARELNVKVYDKALLQVAACESGIDASLFEDDGMGRKEGGGFRMGNTCIPVEDSF